MKEVGLFSPTTYSGDINLKEMLAEAKTWKRNRKKK